MGKKRKCMAQGGAVYPQERPVKPVQDPEWKQSLSRAWEAIKGNAQPNPNPPPTANTLADTASAIVKRKVDNLDAMKRAGYAVGGLAGFKDYSSDPYFSSIQDAMPTSMTPTSLAPTVPSWRPMETGQSLGRIDGHDYRGVDPSRPTQNDPQQQIMDRSKARIDEINGMKGVSDRQRVAALSGVAAQAGRFGVNTDIAGAVGIPASQLSNRQNLAIGQAQFGADTNVDAYNSKLRPVDDRRRFADGGMTTFRGKGGPREDQIPVTVAGEEINVSNGEAGLILPAKTAKSPQALSQIAQTIAQSNDGRMPKMGIEAGGKYQTGVIDDELPNRFAHALSASPANKDIQSLYAKESDRLEGFNATKAAQALGGIPMEKQPAGLSQVAKTPLTSAAADRAMGVPDFPAQSPQAVKQALAKSTNNAGDAAVNPVTGNLHFTQPGFDPTNESFSSGTGAISNKAGKTIVVTPGNYTAADGTPTSDWYKTQAYADAIKRNEDDKARLAMMVAERQGRDPVQSLATRQGMAIAAQEAPMKQQLAQQQVAQGEMTAQQAQELQAARNAITNAKTPEDQEMAIRIFRALNPKSDDKRFIPQTAKTYDNGMPTGEEVRMFDAHTQKWLSPDAPSAVPEASKRKVGQVYDTPKGKMVWRGNGWEAA